MLSATRWKSRALRIVEGGRDGDGVREAGIDRAAVLVDRPPRALEFLSLQRQHVGAVGPFREEALLHGQHGVLHPGVEFDPVEQPEFVPGREDLAGAHHRRDGADHHDHADREEADGDDETCR
jgi:hypothetical protein